MTGRLKKGDFKPNIVRQAYTILKRLIKMKIFLLNLNPMQDMLVHRSILSCFSEKKFLVVLIFLLVETMRE